MSVQFIPRGYYAADATKMAKNMAMALPLSELSFVSPAALQLVDADFENFLNTQTPSDTTNANTLYDSSPCGQDEFPSLPEECTMSDFDLIFEFLKDPSDASDVVQSATPYVQPTLFSSLDEAREAVRRQGSTAWDPTFPQTTEEMRNLISSLKVAMKSVAHAKDSKKTIKPFAEGRHSDLAIEVACWELLNVIMTRHTNGASFTEAHEKRETGLFQVRFEKVVHGLQVSKSICKHLLDEAYNKVFVDDPLHAVKRVSANKKVNDNKKDLIDQGKEAAALAAQAAADAANGIPLTPPSTNKKRKQCRA
ncbi:hypothetical protein N7504_000797 [Penicillium tannophilum]|nr:hypothetical protein N7504_000797 [Penicillium tannophilum]